MSKKSKLPTPNQVVEFIKELDGQSVSKREIARHFKIKGHAVRIELKELLRQMTYEGVLEAMPSKSFRLPGTGRSSSPEMIDIRVVGFNKDHELFAETVDPRLRHKYSEIIVHKDENLMAEDIAKALINQQLDGSFIATNTSLIEHDKDDHFFGMFERDGEAMGHIQPLQKRLQGIEFCIHNPPEDLADGCVVMFKPLKRPQSGPTPVEIVKIISDSLEGQEVAIAIQEFDIPSIFPREVVAESEQLAAFTEKDMGKREDLRKLPIVTIDGADAKDFDDAVWAEPYSDGKIKNGHHIIVAIADVAHYIREHSPLDDEALNRGNSVYFPGTVVPMLPERLCNDLCSLRPHEDRPVLAVHMYVDSSGKLVKHKFVRAVIHSHARLTYEQVQQALDGKPDEVTTKLLPTTILPLYEAYKTLIKAREKRGALDLDVAEKIIVFGQDQGITTEGVYSIVKRERLTTHRLIEEMMVLANVAAATALETIGAPCLYRTHPEPGKVKLDNLKEALKGFGVKFNLGNNVTPGAIQNIIGRVRNFEESEAIMQVMLRSQEQARYNPENIGHFGLALQRYAHFTSPIRRYSDLVVHRHLIRFLNLAGDGAAKDKVQKLKGIADHLGITERRAQQAEWNVRDRLTVRFYKDAIDKEFEAHVVTVAKFGMFISIDGGIAEGLLPLRMMTDDHYIFNEKNQTLFGKRTKKVYKVGSKVKVVLIEADQVAGRLTFAPAGYKDAPQKPDRRRSSKKPPRAPRTERTKERKPRKKVVSEKKRSRSSGRKHSA